MTHTSSSAIDVALTPKTPSEVAKAITYIALGLVGILVTSLADDVLSSIELIQAAIVVLGLIPVYLLSGTTVKTGVTFLVAGLQAVALLIADGTGFADVSLSSWLAVVVTAFGAIGVAVVPNAPARGRNVKVNLAPMSEEDRVAYNEALRKAAQRS